MPAKGGSMSKRSTRPPGKRYATLFIFQPDDLNSCQYSIKTIVAESAVKS
jgi:hypothetical protein